MYVEWYGVCDFVDYGGVYVFHVCALFIVLGFVLMSVL